jgi:hypothetical protein
LKIACTDLEVMPEDIYIVKAFSADIHNIYYSKTLEDLLPMMKTM